MHVNEVGIVSYSLNSVERIGDIIFSYFIDFISFLYSYLRLISREVNGGFLEMDILIATLGKKRGQDEIITRFS
jgi:hypothetical protein